MPSQEAIAAHQQLANQIHDTSQRLNAQLQQAARAGLVVMVVPEESEQKHRLPDGSFCPSFQVHIQVYTPLYREVSLPSVQVADGAPDPEVKISFGTTFPQNP